MDRSILTTLDYNIKTFEALFDKETFFKEEIEKYKDSLALLDARACFLKDSKILYTQAVDFLYKESIGALQETLDTALQYVMFDKDYSVKLELDDARGTKTLNIALTDNEAGFDVDLKDGVGNTIRCIISFVLKMFYLLNEGSKILLLDEKYSYISAQYVPLFFEFVKRMTEEKDFIFVMITHDPRFMDYADRVYSINDGKVVLVGDSDGKEEN